MFHLFYSLRFFLPHVVVAVLGICVSLYGFAYLAQCRRFSSLCTFRNNKQGRKRKETKSFQNWKRKKELRHEIKLLFCVCVQSLLYSSMHPKNKREKNKKNSKSMCLLCVKLVSNFLNWFHFTFLFFVPTLIALGVVFMHARVNILHRSHTHTTQINIKKCFLFLVVVQFRKPIYCVCLNKN